VSIRTGGVSDVVSVPTSAVQTNGTVSYVDAMSNGTPTRKVIKVGLVGGIYTQVLSGLHVGQSVMLANLSLAVPSSSANTTGGFGGGGFGGGGGRFTVSGAGGGGFTGAGGFGR